METVITIVIAEADYYVVVITGALMQATRLTMNVAMTLLIQTFVL
jgi:hypothetical protein